MPQTTSTIWMARFTSVKASSKILPVFKSKNSGDILAVGYSSERLELVKRLHTVNNRHLAPGEKALCAALAARVHVGWPVAVGYITNRLTVCRIDNGMKLTAWRDQLPSIKTLLPRSRFAMAFMLLLLQCSRRTASAGSGACAANFVTVRTISDDCGGGEADEPGVVVE